MLLCWWCCCVGDFVVLVLLLRWWFRCAGDFVAISLRWWYCCAGCDFVVLVVMLLCWLVVSLWTARCMQTKDRFPIAEVCTRSPRTWLHSGSWLPSCFVHGQRFRRSSYVHGISTLSPAARFKNIPIQGDLWWFDVIFSLEHDWQGLGPVGNLFQDVSSTADQPLICSFLKKPTLVCWSSVEMGGPMFFVHVARSQVGYPMRLLWHLWKT